MARTLRDALPGGDEPLRGAVWAFLRPILSPRLTALNRDAFVPDAGIESTVDLAAHRADADLDNLDLGDDRPEAASTRGRPGHTTADNTEPSLTVRDRSFASGLGVPHCPSIQSRRWTSPAAVVGAPGVSMPPDGGCGLHRLPVVGNGGVAAARCPVAWWLSRKRPWILARTVAAAAS